MTPKQPLEEVRIRVVNIHHRQPPDAAVRRFNVMRPSPLGNPFRIGPDGDRTLVIAKYRQWLIAATHINDQSVVAALTNIARAALRGPVELQCCCHPSPCHADVIREVVTGIMNRTS